ncbi:sugar phosphorylase [Lutibacter sp.]|uniref:sugar phosphorylase n=1 Tax=Lutibacter sp. TaxID=1925666 RepID=UPI0025C4E47C|nr:sugar phosphorylase [Lutibacter sp.]MCF6181359.1 sugar phosphorylase [Lutibacter sp.]
MKMIKPKDKELIKEELTSLYGDKVDWLLENIDKLLSKYAPLNSFKNNLLNEKDVILITYGDTIQQKGSSYLQTLNKFINKYSLPEINTTHILPFFPYTSDDGFSITDYFKVNPDLGSWEDISEIAKNSNLMFDAVVNHMSKSSNWFQSFLKGEKDFQDFFIEVDSETDVSKVTRPRASLLLNPFKDEKGNEKYIWTTFSEDQVDLNFKSPQVFIKVLEVLLFYASKQAKFIRFDAVAFLWKTIGTNCIHLPETHSVIQLYKKITKVINPNIYFITETNVPHQENISYFGNGFNEADLVYNFTLAPLLVYAMMKKDVKVLTKWATSIKLPSNKVCMFNFTASHDGIGVRPLQNIISDTEINELAAWTLSHNGEVSYKNNEDGSQSPYELNCNFLDILSDEEDNNQTRAAKMLLTQSVMIAMPGIPGIYIHSLIGSQNDYEGVKKSGIKRRINREKLTYNAVEKELETENSIRKIVFGKYKELLAIRTKEQVFNPFGNAKYFAFKNSVFVIKRTFKDDVLYALFNFSGKSIKIKALSKEVYDLIKHKNISNAYWKINAYSFLWLKNS